MWRGRLRASGWSPGAAGERARWEKERGNARWAPVLWGAGQMEKARRGGRPYPRCPAVMGAVAISGAAQRKRQVPCARRLQDGGA